MKRSLCYNTNMKSGTVILLGRPNSGKSTLVNNLIGQKVSITSPKPQTTQREIKAVYEDERGQIIFIDPPGLTKEILSEYADLVLYVIDHTRWRGTEENKSIGILRRFAGVPKILVFNKGDVKKPSYKAQYKFLEEEVDEVVEVSALKRKNLKNLLDAIFKLLPEKEAQISQKEHKTPLLNIDSKTFIAEIIREKIYLFMGEEIPYQTRVVVDEIKTRDNGTLYIKAKIITTNSRYKKMLIGRNGRKIKQIGSVARKELELSRNEKVFLDLTVEVKN